MCKSLKYRLMLLLLISRFLCFGQSDTIFSGNDTILCSVLEVGLKSISYTVTNYNSSPLFVIQLKNVNAYRIGSQQKVELRKLPNFKEQSELWLSKEALIIKANPLAPLNSHFSFAVEQSLSKLFNIEFEAGYCDSQIFPKVKLSENGMFQANGEIADFNGGFFRPSVKIKKMEYRNLNRLNMYFLRLDAVLSTIKFYDVRSGDYRVGDKTSDITIWSYAMMLNAGYQVCWSNGIVLEGYLGLGISDFDYDIANKEAFKMAPFYYKGIKEYLMTNVHNFYSFRRIGASGLTYAAGIRFGYRFMDK